MKIIGFQAENFKRLKLVKLNPDGTMNVIGGDNEQGKTSLLDAIEAAFGGLKHAPDEPVRKGTKGARIVIDTGEFTLTRKFPAKGASTLELKAKDGSVFPSPQAMLDSLVTAISYDPINFVRQPGKAPADAARAQAATLRKLVGLDFTLLDTKHKQIYDERTEVTRELKSLQARLDRMPDVDGDSAEVEVSVNDLALELKKRQAANTAKADKGRDLERLREKARATSDIIEDLELKLKASREMLVEIQTRGKALKAELDAMPEADVAEVEAKLADADAINRRVRARDERARVAADYNAQVDKSQALTEALDDIDAQKKKATEEAEYPVEGLAVTDDGITLDGVLFSQASAAQQLKVSIAIGLALNPTLKVLLIRDGSLLDKKSMATVAKMAAEADAQLWVEVVGQRDDATVIIEDGEVMPAELCGGLDPKPSLQPAGLAD